MKSDNPPVLLSHDDTDALIRSITEQISLDTFARDNHPVIRQMVELLPPHLQSMMVDISGARFRWVVAVATA